MRLMSDSRKSFKVYGQKAYSSELEKGGKTTFFQAKKSLTVKIIDSCELKKCLNSQKQTPKGRFSTFVCQKIQS